VCLDDVDKENDASSQADETETKEIDTTTIAGLLETCVIIWEGIKDQLDKVCFIHGKLLYLTLNKIVVVVNLCILINVRGQLHGRKSCSFPHSHICCFIIVTNSLSSGLEISVGHGHCATHS
jgi:hypothetical protein